MLNRNYIRNYPIRVPDLAGQRSISKILAALDDKIEINGKVSRTCLSLATTLYGYASSSESWHDLQLKDAGRWYSGGTPSTGNAGFWGGNIPWISAASLRSPWIQTSDRCLTGEGVAHGTRLVPAGSIIFVVRGMSLKSEFRIGLAQREVAFGQDCKAIVARDGVSPHVLLHGLLSRSEEILGLVDEAGHGTGRLATDRIGALRILIPPGPEYSLVKQIEDLDRIAADRQAESKMLGRLRYTLLPKLMSGEIRVRDAEKIVEDVT
jgi:type I restriction enzyme S subunit